MSRLNTLTRVGVENHGRYSAWTGSDPVGHLSEVRRTAWGQILTSAANLESLEDALITPLKNARSHSHEVAEYLDSHSQDEERHHELLNRYALTTFGHVRRHKSVSDRVVYEGAVPALTRAFKRQPVLGFALIHAYEVFSIPFYAHLKKSASEDGAENLVQLLTLIEKDELRHVAGMKELMIAEKGNYGAATRAAAAAILGVFLFDTNQSPWAIHNKSSRARLTNLGIPHAEVNRAARSAVSETLALMKN